MGKTEKKKKSKKSKSILKKSSKKLLSEPKDQPKELDNTIKTNYFLSGKENLKNSIYFFKELNRKDMQEQNFNKIKSIENETKCTIHNETYEYFCSDCECLVCEQCRNKGPHHEYTHKLIHLEQIIGLAYTNQAHFCGKDLVYLKKSILKIFNETAKLMHHLKHESGEVYNNTME